MDIYLIAVGILLLFAVFDLVVGVSNDAVNFLNSSIGSRVAPLAVIITIACLGIVTGVLFSSGMMEVARKGIFHPQFFSMPELMMIFMAVMITDIVVLDLFNTFGMPTSTTVSIVFELLGAAVAAALIKVLQADQPLADMAQYINTAKALAIISGILLSVVISFICGALVQFATRLIFTFDYRLTVKRYGALWGGLAMATICLFILVKGAKGATFVDAQTAAWIKSHHLFLFGAVFAMAAMLLQVLQSAFNVNIFKPIVLVGTFALALAFAANDLVNFIGVPLAGLHAYRTAAAAADPLTASMAALGGKVQSETHLLLLAGLIMVVTLCFSRKARTVTETEVNLGRQDEGAERFESIAPARVIVRMATALGNGLQRALPRGLRKFIRRRLNTQSYEEQGSEDDRPSFDLLRASVNLMVASAVVSYATSMKLPLSTTYVTFMVAMGTSFSDQAWGRDSAVYRVTGVLAVIGGWFMTALVAFSLSFGCCALMYMFGAPGAVLLFVALAWILWQTHHTHEERSREKQEEQIFNLKKIKDAPQAVSVTFEHTAIFLREVRSSLDLTLEALFAMQLGDLRAQKKVRKKLQTWSNVIIANIFKALRLLEKDDSANWAKYGQTINCLQGVTESYRDIVLRSYVHLSDNHKGLLTIQITELRELNNCIAGILTAVEEILSGKRQLDLDRVRALHAELTERLDGFSANQVERVRNRSSKTRLTILFYSIAGNFGRISRQSLRLLEIFEESFPLPLPKDSDAA